MSAARPPLLQVRHLSKHFPVRGGFLGRETGRVQAVDDVSFELDAGETLGLVGESGCGKSTLGRSLLRLIEPSGGEVRFDGRPVTGATPAELRALTREMQIIFQDPFASLNPRMTVAELVAEPLVIHRVGGSAAARREQVAELLRTVGLSPDHLHRFPHEFSGGQRQRIGIARALALKPRLLVCDEAVSALDVSIQAQVINLLEDLRAQFGLAYLFIAHDLAVVEHLSHRVAVMYLGRIVEIAPSEALYRRPQHPYTEALLASVPVPDPQVRRRRIPIVGELPSPLHPPAGCHFHPRCPLPQDARCRTERPPLRPVGEGADRHWVACHLRPA